MYSLHCLVVTFGHSPGSMLAMVQNSIRKAIHAEYFLKKDTHPLPEALQRIHAGKSSIQPIKRDHDPYAYVNRAQYRTVTSKHTMCRRLEASPFAPVWGRARKALIGTPQVHTCRNWHTLRRWCTKGGEKYGIIRGSTWYTDSAGEQRLQSE